MALSNNERVGKALELLNTGLRPFVLQQMQTVYGPRAAEEARATLKLNESRKLAGAEDGLWDTHAMLVIMWDRWNDVFRNTLGFAERSLVSELREVRNKWAHQQVFSTDDTYRALDSISRLLASISPDHATEVDRHKQEVLRLRFGEQQIREDKNQHERKPTKLSPASAGTPEGSISTIDSASDLLDPGETAIVLFTNGMHLTINPDGSGTSGNWIMSRSHRPDKVVIYYRLPEQVPLHADIYLADYASTANSPERGRRVVRFQAARRVGSTNRNWREFADANANPVRYLRKSIR